MAIGIYTDPWRQNSSQSWSSCWNRPELTWICVNVVHSLCSPVMYAQSSIPQRVFRSSHCTCALYLNAFGQRMMCAYATTTEIPFSARHMHMQAGTAVHPQPQGMARPCMSLVRGVLRGYICYVVRLSCERAIMTGWLHWLCMRVH